MENSVQTLEIEQNSVDLPVEDCNYKEILTMDRIPAKDLDYITFFRDYMMKNKPVIITDVSNDWPCSKKWINLQENKINFDVLKQEIPNTLVPVVNCSKQYFNSHEKSEKMFHEYLDWWKNLDNTSDGDLLYLKDWHLQQQTNNHFYNTPKYFGSDWLNEYLIETGKDDYRFVYMGPKNSWTPFHADVFSSFSWSTNIFGRKRWVFLSPKEEEKLLNNLNQLPFSIENISDLEAKNVQFYDINQNPNESIFVPSGWYHQVWNLDNTISINHNWFNGTQIHEIWIALKLNYNKVLKEIEDCRDMDNFLEHSQIMLRAFYGMNFEDFVEILEFICKRRIQDGDILDKYQFRFGPFHKKFDLKAIFNLTNYMLTDKELLNETLLDRVLELNKISSI